MIAAAKQIHLSTGSKATLHELTHLEKTVDPWLLSLMLKQMRQENIFCQSRLTYNIMQFTYDSKQFAALGGWRKSKT